MGLRLNFLIAFLAFTLASLAQNAQVKQKQRAIFIYNFAQQVGWSSSVFEDFTIGILGDDSVYDELLSMKKEGRTIKGKPIQVKKFNSIKSIERIQLLYIHKRFNYNIKDILKETTGKQTLVVSEDYGFNSSMINMIDIDDTFHFEINLTRMNKEGFSISPSLKRMAISTADRWQDLYQQSSQSLRAEQEKVNQQRNLLEEQQQLLDKQKVQIQEQIMQIDARNVEVEALRLEYKDLINQNNELHTKYLMEASQLDTLRDQLDSQRLEITQKRADIITLDQTLNQQKQQIAHQSKRIESQQEVLSQQKADLNYQRNFTILFIIISVFAVVAGFFGWRSYTIKRKAGKTLAKKNQAIEAQKKELQAQNKEMEQFAFVASHDLQEPLNTITGLTQLVMEEDELDEGILKRIRFISDSTDRMRQLIRGLLEYSKLGRIIEFEEVDCNQILEHVKANLSKVIEDNEASIQIGMMPVVKGHEIQLTLLFQNLISNAIKFRKSDRKPLVQITSKQVNAENGTYWLFEIRDNGIGMPSEHLGKVFEIFKRLHSRSQYPGTGIGLAHCKKIVDHHGGEIWVESEVDSGSTFYFTI